jgi:hypothetical protein
MSEAADAANEAVSTSLPATDYHPLSIDEEEFVRDRENSPKRSKETVGNEDGNDATNLASTPTSTTKPYPLCMLSITLNIIIKVSRLRIYCVRKRRWSLSSKAHSSWGSCQP